MLDRVIAWGTLIFIVAFAAVLSWGIVDAIRIGEIRSPSKSGSGVLHLLSGDPAGFWAAVTGHIFMAGLAWGVAYWFWSTQLRNDRIG